MTDYGTRIRISLEGHGDTTTEFLSSAGFLLARGYERIVIGERGPHVEFYPKHMVLDAIAVPQDQRYRLASRTAYHVELRSLCGSEVKIYKQRRRVDYADYQPGAYYISAFDLYLSTGMPVIDMLRHVRQAYLGDLFSGISMATNC